MKPEHKIKMNTIEKQMMKIFLGGGSITALLIGVFFLYMPIEARDDERFGYFIGAVIALDIVIFVIGFLRRRQMINDLKQSGRFLEAKITKIKQLSGKNNQKSYKIYSEAVHPMIGRSMVFTSGSMNKDPQKKAPVGSNINVFYDMNDPYYYWVDISHLK